MGSGIAQDVRTLEELSAYYTDVVEGLTLFFESVWSRQDSRYLFFSSTEIVTIRKERFDETDSRASLAILARIEAAFRLDYLARCENRAKDPLSRDFRDLYKKTKKPHLIGLDEQILERWSTHHPYLKGAIGELRGALKFRHWLAHGRYFNPKLGRRYDYAWLFVLAEGILGGFPFIV